MKLSKTTIAVLKNFATINANILFTKDNELKTMDDLKRIFAKAPISDDITDEFGIYDLNEFLSTLSLFDDPEIMVTESNNTRIISMASSDGSTTVEYVCSDPDILTVPPNKSITIPDDDKNIRFTLKAGVLDDLKKAASVLAFDTFTVERNKGKTTLNVKSSTGSTKNKYSIADDNIESSLESFKAVFDFSNFRFLPCDYDVVISPRGVSQWTSTDVKYWIAVEQKTSEFIA